VWFVGRLTPGTGNCTTAEKLKRLFGEIGVSSRLVDALELSRVLSTDETLPDVIVAIHALRGGDAVLQQPLLSAVPLIVLLSGTDVNVDCADESRARVLQRVLNRCRFVVSLSRAMLDKFRAFSPTTPVVHIPQAVELPECAMASTPPLRAACGLPDDAKVALLVASIRAVKSPDFLLKEVLQQRESGHTNLHLAVVGPVLDSELFLKLQSKGLVDCSAHDALAVLPPLAVYHPPVERNILLSWMTQADVVVNSSESEGQSNVILEAMSLGKPVVARENSGNVELVAHARTGLVYSTPEDGLAQCLHCCGILPAPTLTPTASLTAAAREFVQERHGWLAEVKAWRELLQAVRPPDS
jgi:glycosyltransferase involved in cell wall biosynthesis